MDGTAEINPARILLVEDEALVCAMICDALLEHGFEVHAVGNAGDALQYLRDGGPVDVLFTDINLPGEIDGALLAQEARAMRPDLPVVFASGLALWFPELTLRVLPGSFLNVAQIIHGDEALLAVGSLLTYHVFHMVVLNRWLVPARAEPSQPESLPGPELESQRR